MSVPPAPAARATARLESIDLLRGVIVVIMALDHTRDFFGAIGADPTNLAVATPGLFLTRWVTHICAPVFFLLTGTGAWFSGRRRSPAGLSRYLVTRGLWLVLLEFTVVRCLGLQFNFDYQVTILTVLWALGWSMVALAFLSRLPVGALIVFGAALVLGHNALDGVAPATFGSWAPLWSTLHAPGVLWMRPGHIVIVAYTLIPWVGVTTLGYALGALFERSAEARVTFLRRTGAA
ncbi:MAG TPA: heparan-alpha-glucosaminide N-acetyltransferase domain-containing protein, partial [Gemmatimonadales bacterium]|nr:heparan-alpha-glucosaminide N-acetyltransferase domain-containing protein [Gemmatimonadales bacterium]